MIKSELNELSALLDAASDGHKKTDHKPKPLCEYDMFMKENVNEKNKKDPCNDKKRDSKSEVHQGETDSSDDENNRNPADQKYNDYGCTIKHLLKTKCTTVPEKACPRNMSWKNKQSTFAAPIEKKSFPNQKNDIYTEPYFGLRIVTPLISSTEFNLCMQDKDPVTFSRLQSQIEKTHPEGYHWVVAGVIVGKKIKQSQKGKPYVIWTLSDLKDRMETVSLFLFGNAYQKLWKTNENTVVAVLNPKPLDTHKQSSDIATLSVIEAERVMVLGQSKDMGTCRAMKKNGEPCKSIVNKNRCEYCIYHVKNEYKKFTTRSELQAPSGGSLTQLRNKVLGKNEVFYAGKSYTATVAKPQKKQVAKDQKRLSQLFNKSESRFGSQVPVPRVLPADSCRVKLMKEAERMYKLTGSPATMTSFTLKDCSTEKKESLNCGKLKKGNNKTMGNTNFNGNKILNLKNKDNLSEVKAFGKSKGTEALKNKFQERISKKECKPSETPQSSGFGSSKLSSSNIQKQPTKTRFDSLNKLQSQNSCGAKSPVTLKEIQTFKAPCRTQPEDIDVYFEFDESNTSKTVRVTMNFPKECNPNLTFKSGMGEPTETSTYKVGNFTKESHTPKESAMSRIPCLKKHLESNLKPTSSGTCIGKSLEYAAPDQKFTLGMDNNLDKSLSSVKPSSLPETGKLVLTKNHINSSQLRQSEAKLKALKYVKQKGSIVKKDPNVNKTREALLLNSKRKRAEEEEISKSEKSALNKKFLDLMNTSSKHLDLIDQAESQEMDEYYLRMEKKEQMEEKMMNTFKVDCKAVRCLKCNYKWFSASEQCKVENHPIKVISAVKRFFQCQNCKKRTVSLDIIPMHNCFGCGSSSWKRAPMMQERKSANVHLSIRGGEQKFTNSVTTDANLDLLVPDDGP